VDATGGGRKCEYVASGMRYDAMCVRRSTTSGCMHASVARIQADIRTQTSALTSTRTNCRPAKCIDFAAAPTKLRFRARAAVVASSFSNPRYDRAPLRHATQYLRVTTNAREKFRPHLANSHNIAISSTSCVKYNCLYKVHV